MQFEGSLLDVGRIPMDSHMAAYTLCINAAEEITGYGAMAVSHAVQESHTLMDCVDNVSCIIDACRSTNKLSEQDRVDLGDFITEFIDEYVKLVA